MKRIIGIFKPFELEQTVLVYENGNKIDSKKIKTQEAYDTIFGLAEEYQIDRVDLTGPKQYVRGLIKHFEEEEVKRYSKSSITFNQI